MTTLPLQLRKGHVFVEPGGEPWLLDTGAPTSFGTSRSLTIAGEQFRLGTSSLGLTPATLWQFEFSRGNFEFARGVANWAQPIGIAPIAKH